MFEQTDPMWEPSIFSDELGTGIFVGTRGDDPNNIFKEFVENITYRECVRRARSGPYDHFKWIPERIEPYRNLQTIACAGGSCRVVKDCFQVVCFCRGGQCV
jgi:hypothetical protein